MYWYIPITVSVPEQDPDRAVGPAGGGQERGPAQLADQQSQVRTGEALHVRSAHAEPHQEQIWKPHAV